MKSKTSITVSIIFSWIKVINMVLVQHMYGIIRDDNGISCMRIGTRTIPHRSQGIQDSLWSTQSLENCRKIVTIICLVGKEDIKHGIHQYIYDTG